MKRAAFVRFRRSPAVVCYWEAGRLVLHNYATHARIAADPITIQILDLCDDWILPRALALHFPAFTPVSLSAALHALAANGILLRSDRKPHPLEHALQQPYEKPGWRGWSPDAAFLHFASKDETYQTDIRATRRALLKVARKYPMPEPIKSYSGARRIPLPPPQTGGDFPQVLLARRTHRDFSARPVELTQLATLLGLTWRIQQWKPVAGFGRRALKTSPSGGGLHPNEVYVAARNVRGLPPGVYHYSADNHRLELIRRGMTSRRLATYLGGQEWAGGAAAMLLLTAVFPRTQWKYRVARGYRAVLVEAGHFCQTFCLVATWLGLAPFCSMALADSKIERDLRIDGVNESVLYAAGVGAPAESPPSEPIMVG